MHSEKRFVEQKSSHPWLNESVERAVADKRDAEGTPSEKEQAKACSSIVLREYNDWVRATHHDLANMRQGSKAWLKKERQLQLHKQKCSSIPALKLHDGTWTCDNKGKADALATALAGKYALANLQEGEYTAITDETLEWLVDRGKVLHPEAAKNIMVELRADSATGPDAVPTRLIKNCANSLALPVYLLALAILRT